VNEEIKIVDDILGEDILNSNTELKGVVDEVSRIKRRCR
jgi:hypothetical protein